MGNEALSHEELKILNRIIAQLPKLGTAQLRWLNRRIESEIGIRERLPEKIEEGEVAP